MALSGAAAAGIALIIVGVAFYFLIVPWGQLVAAGICVLGGIMLFVVGAKSVPTQEVA